MGETTLTEFTTAIRAELVDTGSVFATTQISRAVTKTESILDRAIPKKAVYEGTYTAAGSETLVISTSTGTLSTLPVKYASETITNASGTKMVRGTNYTINYMTGVVSEVGSALPDAADYTCTYTIDPKRIAITSTITDPISITRLEYPVGDQPATYIIFDQIFNHLIISGDIQLSNGNNYRIYYDSQWTHAAASTDGDYPAHLDDAIVIGASGQTLIFQAEKYVQAAVGEVLLINAATDSMATPLADINASLDKVALYLETNEITGAADDASARAILEELTTQVADLRTKVTVALAAAAAYTADVDTTDLGGATYGAENLLKVPVDSTLINTVTIGDQVTQKYVQLAAATVGIGNARIAASLAQLEEANSRLDDVRSYIEEAGAWSRIAEDFIGEAVQRIAEVQAWAIQAEEYQTAAEWYMEIAGRYLASGQAKINEFYTIIGWKTELQHGRAASAQSSKY